MRLFRKNYFAIVGVLSLFLVVGCSKDKDKDSSGNIPADLGTASLTVSGAVEGEFNGMADFYGQDFGSISYWEISCHDFGPQTFSMGLTKMGTEEIERPGVGTYTLTGTGMGDDEFTASFEYIENEDYENTKSFDIVFGGGGTLTIEKSTDKVVKGSFQFTAKTDEEEEEEIEVEGTFEAHPRIF